MWMQCSIHIPPHVHHTSSSDVGNIRVGYVVAFHKLCVCLWLVCFLDVFVMCMWVWTVEFVYCNIYY